jgi:hypothetical protein
VWFVVGGITAGTGVSAIHKNTQPEDYAPHGHHFCVDVTLCTP